MSKLRLRISMSLDGFVAGTDQSVAPPLGVDDLHRIALVDTIAAPAVTHLEFTRKAAR